MSEAIRVLIVDDHFMVRLGLTESIRTEHDLTVVAHASTGAEALSSYAEHHPDVVTMDFRLPDMTGAEAAAELLARHPGARILMLSVSEAEEDIWRAVQAGAAGYLLKSCGSNELLAALRKIHQGGEVFPPGIGTKIAERSRRSNLTPREIQILGCIVGGMSNKEIMEALHLSEGTVKLHVANLLHKLGAMDRTQAAMIAVQRGLVQV